MKTKKYKLKICEKCERKYLPTTGVQQFCKKCGLKNKAQRLREAVHRYYIRHKKEAKIRKHKWYISNKELIRQHQKEYRQRSKLNKQNKKICGGKNKKK